MEDIVGVPMSVDAPLLQANDMVVVVDIPVPMVQTVLNTLEAPWLQFLDVRG